MRIKFFLLNVATFNKKNLQTANLIFFGNFVSIKKLNLILKILIVLSMQE